MNQEALTASLKALRGYASVTGVILARGSKVVAAQADLLPFQTSEVMTTLDDIIAYFRDENRKPDQLAFGYDGAQLIVFIQEPYRLIITHREANEIDMIAMAARAFLLDYEMGMMALSFAKGRVA
jgi:hypothetical protein